MYSAYKSCRQSYNPDCSIGHCIPPYFSKEKLIRYLMQRKQTTLKLHFLFSLNFKQKNALFIEMFFVAAKSANV
jgi:hypothetical protein